MVLVITPTYLASMAQKKATVDDLVAVVEKEKVLELSKDDLQTVLETASNGLIPRLCVPARYPKCDGFTKVLQRLWGSDCISYTELGHKTMVARFASAEARDKVLKMNIGFVTTG